MNINDLKQGNDGQPIERNGAHQNKRKSEDGSGSALHTRSKRNRYISIAWSAPLLYGLVKPANTDIVIAMSAKDERSNVTARYRASAAATSSWIACTPRIVATVALKIRSKSFHNQDEVRL